MDGQKDIQKFDRVSSFLGSKTIHTNPFGENHSADRAYRRAERLVAALYLITGHVSSEEPVRSSIRSLAGELLSLILEVRDEMRSSGSQKMRSLASTIRELISSVQMLAISGSLSTQNADIIIEALDELGVFLHSSQKSLLSESVRITREDLSDTQKLHTFFTSDRKSAKDSITDIDTKSLKNQGVFLTSQRVRNSNGSMRRASILEVLKSGGTLGIRDIAANLPEYSEKMIQRELADLTIEKRVEKIGSKRWSRYAIATMS